jgi:two-component system sensor histidine kinase KdpD
MNSETSPLPEPPRRKAEDFLALINQQKQGKLKIYLGACAGVGKTYQMLVEGNRLRRRGVDVVIGYVEPHARPETTAQIGELEIVPPVVTHYKGVALREMNTAAVIARAPTVALVDELAHTNAPGTKTKKRFEDVEDLLAAGISVISTLNIQHLESLYNVVENATGVRVKERIPDEFLTHADQIVNIDLPAEDLIERLQAGKVYPADRVAQAQSNFFTPQNLTRLREMALSESANFLDRRQRADEPSGQDHGPGGGMGQVAVALSSGGPDPGAILRKAARLASQLNAPWYAVYVRTPGEAPRVITAEAQRVIGETLEAAQRMGGVVIVLKREQVAAALVDFVREYGITHLVVGRPVAPRGWLRWQATLLEVLLRELKSVDVVVV